MKTFEVFKAQGIGRDEEIRSASLVAAEAVPDPIRGTKGNILEKVAELYTTDAQKVVDFLTTTLPQGTVDRVLYLLMREKASLFIGPMKEERK